MSEPYASLAHRLQREIEGEVRFDAGSRALYSTDASNYRQTPIGVVLPRTREDVIRTVAACRDHDAPVLARGGGTSLAGQGCNVAVVIDMTKHYDEVLELDPAGRTARVQPGLILDELRSRAGESGLTFGPDPATHSHCTLGGMIGNNACGIHSLTAGKTVDNVVSMEVLTYDGEVLEVGQTSASDLERILARGGRRGEIYRDLAALRDRHGDAVRDGYPDIPRRVSGYNLDELLPEKGFHAARALVGTEGTCVTYLEATVRLVENPGGRSLLVLGYEDVFAAADQVPAILEYDPIALEGMDVSLIQNFRREIPGRYGHDILPEGSAWLLVEFGGTSRDAARERARHAREAIGAPTGCAPGLYEDPEEEALVWRIREEGLGATARMPGRPDMHPGWEDSAVHPEDLADYLRDLEGLFDEYGLETSVYGHFGEGCVHCRIPFDLRTADGLEAYRAFVEEAAELCCGRYGGSLSGEHGDGLSRGPLLSRMYSEELIDAMRAFKGIWDPEDRMNPGRIVEAADPTEHLRLGADFAPATVESRYSYPEDDGDFSRAVLRCVGVGKCRREGGGTMCPSWMATREEAHSTRGRARMLFEMLNGEEIGGWRDDAVLDSLDLCLGCKGCKSDCPVSVDMATYKSEYLSHHYARRPRPRAHYAMGLIRWGARLAAKMPGLANRLARAPVLSRAIKWTAGVAPERELPAFAEETFVTWFRSRDGEPEGAEERPEVVLFPDTFNDHFHPDVARAAVEALEWAGCRVTIPPRPLCCGRPLFHYGMLDLAERQQRRVLETLRPKIRAGVPIVGLEPSCVATFRDELRGLLPDDEDAERLRENVWLLSEFFQERLDGIDLPEPGGRALLHVHCHQKSVLSKDADRELLERLGYACDVPDAGCCGMAGAFGFERGDKYEVSIACGERVLLPAVREAGDEVVLVTSGYSCREQIAQTTGRRAHHLAEILGDAIEGTPPPSELRLR
ncbi:MAG: FAD-binding and (Fe-S)-binding domain-containing protein [Gemmatimonadota bacterium]|nr:FAD-binding and (Fe-S)-binding domain-containing protein [Gemmatimonadota bacterium]